MRTNSVPDWDQSQTKQTSVNGKVLACPLSIGLNNSYLKTQHKKTAATG